MQLALDDSVISLHEYHAIYALVASIGVISSSQLQRLLSVVLQCCGVFQFHGRVLFTLTRLHLHKRLWHDLSKSSQPAAHVVTKRGDD